MSFLDETGLGYFWSQIKQKFLSVKGGTVSGDLNVAGNIAHKGVSIFSSQSPAPDSMNITTMDPGIYWCNLTNVSGGPATSGYGWLIVYPNQCVQTFIFYDTHITYTRGYTNGKWYEWTCTGGADSVVASGTSGTWRYIKFANGQAICSRTMEFNGAYIGAAVGNLYRSGGEVITSVSYPFSFVGSPSEVVTTRTGSKYVWPIGTTHNTNTSSGGYALLSPVSYNTAQTAVSGVGNMVAIGRWK